MGRKKQETKLPTFDELFIPTIQALSKLGGSGTIEEINNQVYEITNLSNDILQIPHGSDGTTYEVDYRLAWSRTYLKSFGLLDNSSRGIWSLSKSDIDISKLNPTEIKRSVREKSKQPGQISTKTEANKIEEEVEKSDIWKEKLLNTLYDMTPAAFERLTQRLLRESGFSQVEVTGKVGDGGIDGKGIVRVSGLLSFHVIFQCKRYKGTVSPSQIRDFRGAMQGRADKGLVITTGSYTKEAIKEATRDGAPPIDLIDGLLLCDKLKELKLGVDTILTETIEIKTDWFNNL
jgi:restriction system protein